MARGRQFRGPGTYYTCPVCGFPIPMQYLVCTQCGKNTEKIPVELTFSEWQEVKLYMQEGVSSLLAGGRRNTVYIELEERIEDQIREGLALKESGGPADNGTRKS